MRACVRACVRAFMYVCMHVSMCVYACVNVYVELSHVIQITETSTYYAMCNKTVSTQNDEVYYNPYLSMVIFAQSVM